MRPVIHDLHVERDDGGRGDIRRVVVRFGDGHVVEIIRERRGVILRLGMAAVAVVLDASRPDGDFARAVNLLRLHMPDCRPELPAEPEEAGH